MFLDRLQGFENFCFDVSVELDFPSHSTPQLAALFTRLVATDSVRAGEVIEAAASLSAGRKSELAQQCDDISKDYLTRARPYIDAIASLDHNAAYYNDLANGAFFFSADMTLHEKANARAHDSAREARNIRARAEPLLGPARELARAASGLRQSVLQEKEAAQKAEVKAARHAKWENFKSGVISALRMD
jgi:hypothetical protein